MKNIFFSFSVSDRFDAGNDASCQKECQRPHVEPAGNADFQ